MDEFSEMLTHELHAILSSMCVSDYKVLIMESGVHRNITQYGILRITILHNT